LNPKFPEGGPSQERVFTPEDIFVVLRSRALYAIRHQLLADHENDNDPQNQEQMDDRDELSIAVERHPSARAQMGTASEREIYFMHEFDATTKSRYGVFLLDIPRKITAGFRESDPEAIRNLSETHVVVSFKLPEGVIRATPDILHRIEDFNLRVINDNRDEKYKLDKSGIRKASTGLITEAVLDSEQIESFMQQLESGIIKEVDPQQKIDLADWMSVLGLYKVATFHRAINS
jgi:hypothetical protein